jgi:branched-chain amino acid transport system ATP-binding protein
MLQVENLNVYYGAVHALKSLTIHVPEGSVITLIGANGAGKSTLLRSITGLVSVSSGTVHYQSSDITAVPAYDRVSMGIAMVPEGRRIFTNMTVYENLLMGAYSRKDRHALSEDFDRVFTLFPRMKERLAQKGLTLSGGEQQMLSVGRALMSHPKLLLMDEPSLGLAPNLVEEMYRTIEKIHKAGLTVLLVEQNANAALALASYGYVLEVGHIVLEGPCKELAQDEGVKKAYIGA